MSAHVQHKKCCKSLLMYFILLHMFVDCKTNEEILSSLDVCLIMTFFRFCVVVMITKINSNRSHGNDLY